MIGTASSPRAADAATGASPAVAFQGDHGAFSEEAAFSLLAGRRPVTLPRRDFAGVAAAVRDGTADFGVLPVENSIHGSVTGAYDVLGQGGLTVLAERVRPIHLCLLAAPGTRLEQVRRVISHPVALNQCGTWLGSLDSARIDAWYDTAGAAREVATGGDSALAAVAGRHAAECYGLDVLAAGIEDRPDNATRFFLVARAPAPSSVAAAPLSGDGAGGEVDREVGAGDGGGEVGGEGGGGIEGGGGVGIGGGAHTGAWKAVVMMEADHRPGALVRLLTPFADRGVNLTHIESRPAEQPWRYRFFLELTSHDGAATVHAAIEAARLEARQLTLLGGFAT